MYADDCVLLARSHEQLQQILNVYVEVYEDLGLKLNTTKTKIMSMSQVCDQNPQVQINGDQLENVEFFTYLGSILNSKANIDHEIQNRLNAAARAFWKLRTRVFYNHDLSMNTKTAVYRAVILPTLLYGSETWVPYSRHIKVLERIQQRHLRQILRIKWYHRVSNAEVLNRADCQPIETLVTKSRLRWVGHVSRMEEHRLEKCALYGELVAGKRKQGGQRKRYKDLLHDTLKTLNVVNNWETQASDRRGWRNLIHSFNGEKPRRMNPYVPGHFPCPDCGRIITSKIGLFSHRRTHSLA